MKTILFQGDSITDCGRDRSNPNDLGSGYPKLAAAALPDVRVYNRGISGNKASDLASRWQADCLELQPDIVSILIGVNETWRRYDSNSPTSNADYEANYRLLLEPLRARGTKLLLLQPFLLDISESVTAMREDLSGKQAVAERLAQQYGAQWLPADEMFRHACTANRLPPAHYAADGVHPTPAGHALLAEAVTALLKKML